MDTDTLLVLDRGELAEQGAPAELAQRPGGVFAGMAAAAHAAAAMVHAQQGAALPLQGAQL